MLIKLVYGHCYNARKKNPFFASSTHTHTHTALRCICATKMYRWGCGDRSQENVLQLQTLIGEHFLQNFTLSFSIRTNYWTLRECRKLPWNCFWLPSGWNNVCFVQVMPFICLFAVFFLVWRKLSFWSVAFATAYKLIVNDYWKEKHTLNNNERHLVNAKIFTLSKWLIFYINFRSCYTLFIEETSSRLHPSRWFNVYFQTEPFRIFSGCCNVGCSF